MLVYSALWPYWTFYSNGCLSTYSAEWDKCHIKRGLYNTEPKPGTDFRKDRREEFEMKGHSVMVIQTLTHKQGRTKMPKASLHNLLHTLQRQSNRDWVSFYSVCRWRVPSRMWFSSSRRSLQFPLWLLTSLTQPRKQSLEESGKHQRGMRGISAFRFLLSHPLTPCSLYFGCLCAAGLLSFLLFLNAAQQ